jgi:toxin YoeB
MIKSLATVLYEGIEKPQPLKHGLAGYWSRRIDDTNKLVYCVDGHSLVLVACRYHYH